MVVIIAVSYRKEQLKASILSPCLQGIIICIKKVSIKLLAGLAYPEYTKFTFWVNEVL